MLNLGRVRTLDRLCRLFACRRGNSAVEFALAAPVLMGVLTPVADLGLAFSQQGQVQLAAQAGAQYAVLHGWNSSAISNAVTSASPLAAISATPAPSESCGCPNDTGITSTVCGAACANGENPGTYVTVSAQASYAPVLPYSLLGNNMTLSAQTMVRIQ